MMKLVRTLLSALLSSLLLTATVDVYANTGQVQDETYLLRTKDPHTGQEYDLYLPRMTQKEYAAFHPIELEKNDFVLKFIQATQRSTNALTQTTKEIVHMFPAEFASFNAAMGFMTVRRLLTESETDPQMVKNFIAQNITDPVAHASFVAFMMTNKGTNSLLTALGVRFNFLRDEKAYAETLKKIYEHVGPQLFAVDRETRLRLALAAADKVLPTPSTDKAAKILSRNAATASALFVSGLFTEFFKDADIQNCIDGWLSHPNRIPQITQKAGKAPFMSCTHAYERWLGSEHYIKYVPTVSSFLLTAGVMSAVVAPATHLGVKAVQHVAHKSVRLSLAAIQLARLGAQFIPATRFLNAAGHLYTFLELQHLFLVPIEDAFFVSRHAEDIFSLQTKIQTAEIRPSLSVNCQQQILQKYPQINLDQALYTKLYEIVQKNSLNCQNLEKNSVLLLKEYDQKLEAWNSHWSRHVQNQLFTWSQYIEGFQNHYLSAYQFYIELIQLVNNRESAIWKSTPYNGLGGTLQTVQQTNKLLAEAINYSREKIAQLENKKNTTALEKQALQWLKKIEQHFSALDSRRAMSPELQEKFKNLAENDQKNKIRLRNEEFAEGIKLLKKLNQKNIEFFLVDLKNDPYGLATLNDLLKNAEPLGEGWLALDELNENPAVILQKESFQANFGRTIAKNKAESLLVAAVCGPQEPIIYDNFILGLKFQPPRLISHDGSVYCQKIPKHLSNQNLSQFKVRDAKWIYPQTQQELSFIDLLKYYLNPRYLGPQALENFKKDWQNNVEPLAIDKALRIQNNFKGFLDKRFIPQLNSNKLTESINNYQIDDTGLQKVYEQTLPQGSLAILSSQLEVYLGLLDKNKSASQKKNAVKISFDRLKRLISENPESSLTKVLTAEEQKLSNEMISILNSKTSISIRYGLALTLLTKDFENKLGDYLKSLPEIKPEDSSKIDQLEERMLLMSLTLKGVKQLAEYAKAYQTVLMENLNTTN